MQQPASNTQPCFPISSELCHFHQAFVAQVQFAFVVLDPVRSVAMSSGRDVWIDPNAPQPYNPSIGADGSASRYNCDPGMPMSVDGEPYFNADLELDQDAYWDNGEWKGGDFGESAHVSPEEASKFLSDIFIEKYNCGKMFATDVCKMAFWCKSGGMIGAVAELAKRPGLPTSHYNRHLKEVLGHNDKDGLIQYLKLPCSHAVDGSRTSIQLPVIHPHEVFNNEVAESPSLADALAEEVRLDRLPPLVTDHKVFKRSGGKAHPGTLYVDGVPTTKRDGVIGFWYCPLLSKRRHLCAVIAKKRMCKCGCRGWCSLFVIFSWLHWSFAAMAAGEHPLLDWCGAAFEDPIRVALAGTALLYSAALVAIKGDWMEYCTTFAFATWQTIQSPCLSCWSTRPGFLDDREFGFGSDPWGEFTMEYYEIACRSCELEVVVASVAMLKKILQSLFYDKRKKGAHGRALRFDVTGAALMAGDRLEPSLLLPDVALTIGRNRSCPEL